MSSEPKFGPGRYADPFTYIIQHLNSDPYSLTKDECIERVRSLRDTYGAVDQMDELRRAVAEIIGTDPETWPTHGNAPLAIAAALARREARSAAPVAPAEPSAQAAVDVLAERRRQIEAEGWTPEHDDQHIDGGMNVAAACYALANRPRTGGQMVNLHDLWRWTGWAPSWFKPRDPRSNLIRAGALILAEIERLDRVTAKAKL